MQQVMSCVHMMAVMLVVVLVVCVGQSQARTLQRLRPQTAGIKQTGPDSNTLLEREAEIALPGAKEPSLFELLIDALSKSDEQGGDGEKRNNFKQSKPCYWSLVSCY